MWCESNSLTGCGGRGIALLDVVGEEKPYWMWWERNSLTGCGVRGIALLDVVGEE